MSTPRAWTYDELVVSEHDGEKLDFLLFWGHTPPASGELGPHVFSQWWHHPFEVDAATYPTAEHFMMAEKARLFEDEGTRKEILTAESPADAKACGRRVQGFTETLWKAHRNDIVFRASVAKFGSDDELRRYIVGTGDSVLVEASPKDNIWGIGLGSDDNAATKPSQWRGLNLLGFALMRARAELAGV